MDLSLKNQTKNTVNLKDPYSFKVLKHSIKLSMVSFSSGFIILMLLIFFSGAGPNASSEGINIAKHLSVRVFIGPFIETVIFQLLIITTLLRIKILKVPFIIIISAVIFCIYHGYSKFYLVIPLSFVLAYVYCYWLEKTASLKWAFVATYLTHLLHNFFCFLLNFMPISMFFWL